MKKPNFVPSIVLLIVILGSLALSACSTVASAQQMGSLEAQVHTAVAATLIQQVVAATVAAAQPAAVAEAPAEQQAQATQAPTPTATPVPTQAPPPTAQPTAETSSSSATGPTIIADQNTNCRAGPGTGYKVVDYFMEGDESTVEGRDSTKDWWYIVSPKDDSQNCWVWDGSTTVVGDTSTLPVVAAPAAPTYKYGYWYDDCEYYNGSSCVYFPYDNCQKMVWWHGYLVCVQYKPVCNADSWWSCNPYGYCTCKPGYNDPWQKPNCPPLTSVNYKKYCDNYPQCCGE